MITFDIKKISYDKQHVSNYAVRFKPWLVDEKFTTESLKSMKSSPTSACYSSFFKKYTAAAGNINGICTCFLIKPTSGAAVTFEEISRWIELGVKYKMLPAHFTAEYCITPDEDKKDNFYATAAIKCEGVKQAILYMYLNTFRELYEDPGFVKSVIYLHDELGINFYAAYVFGSFFNKVGVGHHILPITKSMLTYGGTYSKNIKILKSLTKNDTNAELDLTIVRALYKFIHDDTVDRGFPILKLPTSTNIAAHCWNCMDKITALANEESKGSNFIRLPIHILDHAEIDAIISEPIEIATRLAKKVLKMEVTK